MSATLVCGSCFLLASVFLLRWHSRFDFFAGIRVAPSRRGRCPCAGRQLLSLPPQRK
jgi:hypothetical protein